MFLVFEGADGSGKTTATESVADWLRDEFGQDKIIITKEPFNPVIAECLFQQLPRVVPGREAIIDAKHRCWITAALFIADRAAHISRVIEPALKAGKMVVCDRFADSTLAYQFYGQTDGEDDDSLSFITDAHRTIIGGGYIPDLSILFHCSPETAAQRLRDSGGQHVDVNLGFLGRVIAGYRKIFAGQLKHYITPSRQRFVIDTDKNGVQETFELAQREIRTIIEEA